VKSRDQISQNLQGSCEKGKAALISLSPFVDWKGRGKVVRRVGERGSG